MGYFPSWCSCLACDAYVEADSHGALPHPRGTASNHAVQSGGSGVIIALDAR